jgi:DNA-binding YbaB/EbfC family protein
MKGFDPNALFQQARKMKEEMGRVQEDLAGRMVEGKAPGGAVRIVVNGNSEVQAVNIQPEAIDPDDSSFLEDLVMVAVKDALEKARHLHDEAMEKATGGMGGLPGLL